MSVTFYLTMVLVVAAIILGSYLDRLATKVRQLENSIETLRQDVDVLWKEEIE